MIYRVYKYVYYRIYSWNLNQWGKSDLPEYNAMIGLALTILINILSVPTVIEAITGYRMFDFPAISKGSLVIGLLIYGSLHYFALYHNGKYKKIIKEFESESEAQRKRGTIWVLVYLVGSVVILFSSWFIIYLRDTEKI